MSNAAQQTTTQFSEDLAPSKSTSSLKNVKKGIRKTLKFMSNEFFVPPKQYSYTSAF